MNLPKILKINISKFDRKNVYPTIIILPAFSQVEVDVMKTVTKIKDPANISSKNPVEIYTQNVSKLNEQAKSKMLLEEPIKKSIRYQKSLINSINPPYLFNLNI